MSKKVYLSISVNNSDAHSFSVNKGAEVRLFKPMAQRIFQESSHHGRSGEVPKWLYFMQVYIDDHCTVCT